MMDISTAALMSIIALVVLVAISCVNDELNVGFLGIGFAILVGGIWGNLTGSKGWELFLYHYL